MIKYIALGITLALLANALTTLIPMTENVTDLASNLIEGPLTLEHFD